MCACMRPYDCKGDVSDRNVRVWRVGMHGHGGSVHASMSYNVKGKVVTAGGGDASMKEGGRWSSGFGQSHDQVIT